LALNAPVLCVPDVALAPDHEPDAAQLVAFVELHVSVDAEPDPRLVGDADNVTVGVAKTETDAFCVTDPPAPEHVSVKAASAVSAPVVCVPDVALAPDQPPDAVQLVAFVAFHVSVDAEPDATLVGDADNVNVGAGETATAADFAIEPPVPVHVSV
jgi:hypothetical protein